MPRQALGSVELFGGERRLAEVAWPTRSPGSRENTEFGGRIMAAEVFGRGAFRSRVAISETGMSEGGEKQQ